MSTTTTNYSWIKPSINDPTDQDLWGGYLNSNLDSQDTTLKLVSDKANLSSPAVSNKTANYTVLSADQNKLITVDATSGSVTITLIAAATAGSGFKIGIKKTDSSANVVTIDANGTETIDGQLTYALSNQYEDVFLVCDGSTWHIQDTLLASATINSSIRVGTANGNGSTNTAIRRFSSTISSVGTDITYADSATLGASFTINKNGCYAISYADQSNTTQYGFGISKNSTQLSTSIASITAADRLIIAYTANNGAPSVACVTVILSSGDVIRPHNDLVATNGTAALSSFTITRIY